MHELDLRLFAYRQPVRQGLRVGFLVLPRSGIPGVGLRSLRRFGQE
jgi:hypothetical protein